MSEPGRGLSPTHSDRRCGDDTDGQGYDGQGHGILGRDSGWRPFGWAALIALLALQVIALYGSDPSVGPVDVGLFPGADKVAHLSGFAVPMFVAGLLRSRPMMVLILAHALTSELFQGWLTSARVMDVWDAAANVAGCALGLTAAWMLNRRMRER